MKSHELAKILLSNPDVKISATVEVDTGIEDKHREVIIAHVECYDLFETIEVRSSPWSETHEIILHFTEAGGRRDGINTVAAIGKAADKAVRLGVL